MSRKLKIFIPVILGIVVVGVIAWAFIAGPFSKGNGESVVLYDADNLPYTEKKWKFDPSESREVIELIDVSSQPKDYVSLCVSGNTYIDVAVPNGIAYYNNICKTVYALDGSYCIRMVNNTSGMSMADLAGIRGYEDVNENMVRSTLGKRGNQTIVAAIPNSSYCIIADVYNGSQNYSIIYDSLLSAKTYIVEDVNLESVKHTVALPISDVYHVSYEFKGMSTEVETLMFESGELDSYTRLASLSDTRDELLVKLMKLAKRDSVDIVFEDGAYFYAECGAYQLGLFKYNDSSTIVLIGHGAEAKANIIRTLDSLM